jgi:hypothetical protein
VTEDLVPTAEEIKQAIEGAEYSVCDVPAPGGGRQPLTVVCRANTREPIREKHVAINLDCNTPRFVERPDLMIRRYEPIAIVGGGPSVKRHLNDIRRFRWIMAAGSSHDYLVSEGITPNFAVVADAKEETLDYYRYPQGKTQYLIASVCPPALFEQLKPYQVYLWNFNEQVDSVHYRGEKVIGWGCMIGVVCIQIALWLGFQEHHYFGYDCCVEPEGSHAYPVSDREKQEIADQVIPATQEDGTVFLTTTPLIAQLTHFYAVYRSQDAQYLKGYVYGRGMLWDNIRQSPPEMKQWLEAV